MGTYDTPIRYGTFYTRLHETIHIVQVIWSSFQIGKFKLHFLNELGLIINEFYAKRFSLKS